MPKRSVASPNDKPKEEWSESDTTKAKIEELINKGKISDDMDLKTVKSLDPDFEKHNNVVFAFFLKAVKDYMKSKS